MLHGPLPAGAESLERRIAREEPGVGVDVLRIHASASFAPCDMGGPEMAPQFYGGPRDGPPPPSVRSAPAEPWRSSKPPLGALRHTPGRSSKSHTLGAPRF